MTLCNMGPNTPTLNSMSTPTGSSAVAAQTSPSFQVSSSALVASQLPSCFWFPTILNCSPKPTCGWVGGRRQTAGSSATDAWVCWGDGVCWAGYTHTLEEV